MAASVGGEWTCLFCLLYLVQSRKMITFLDSGSTAASTQVCLLFVFAQLAPLNLTHFSVVYMCCTHLLFGKYANIMMNISICIYFVKGLIKVKNTIPFLNLSSNFTLTIFQQSILISATPQTSLFVFYFVGFFLFWLECVMKISLAADSERFNSCQGCCDPG